jgi:hypothetical protein
MRMGSDLGKLHRRNYMVKSQLKSLEAKSKSLNQKIDSDTNIDEWAQSHVARADAQIDDVSDYMQFRNLGGLALKKGRLGHVRTAPVRSNTNAIAPPPLHRWGNPAPSPGKDTDGDSIPDNRDNAPNDYNPAQEDEDADGVGDIADDDFGGLGWTDSLPQVTLGNTIGANLFLGLLGAGVGLVTYSQYQSKSNFASMKPRLKKAAWYGLIGMAGASAYQAIVAGGQLRGDY